MSCLAGREFCAGKTYIDEFEMNFLRYMSSGRVLNGVKHAKLSEQSVLVKEGVRPRQKILEDSFGRKHTYLRISLTERCNLRCMYCMPEEGIELSPSNELLTASEIERISKVFLSYGVDKIRLTGGEPLVRKDFDDIVQRIGAYRRDPRYNLKTIAITTNGITLKKKLKTLVDNGLSAVNISLDTLVPQKFELITRRRGHERVIEAIDACLDANFGPVKVNCVLMRGVNDDELLDFCRMTEHKDLDIRFIEYMPFDGNRWSDKKFMSYAEAIEKITAEFGALSKVVDDKNDTSKHYKISGFAGRIGKCVKAFAFCWAVSRLQASSSHVHDAAARESLS
uniref:GTP 3',8-cyclase n=1 Tax=Rhodosorus marinus TaxID=101924 RepID=A0A7S3A0W3_9RHOD|mmetsp:Transcript_38879/g.153723  ORF Transcript_38879/g.153723 Transcript_38879/m.153723 type:complete len:338 (+) Transcript_38879:442-1455(+)